MKNGRFSDAPIMGIVKQAKGGAANRRQFGLITASTRSYWLILYQIIIASRCLDTFIAWLSALFGQRKSLP